MKSFSGSLNGSCRRQIEKSLRRAVETTPALRRWTLVIPRNMTPDRADGRYSDEGWFTTTLAECAPRVTLEWFGVDQLDLAAAGDPAFQRYVDGQYAQVMRQVVDGGSGSTVLAQGATDLFRRNQICREQIDAISQHWTLDFAEPETPISVRSRKSIPGQPRTTR